MDPTELDQLTNDVRSGAVRLFHGGAPRLRRDDFLLPPSVTGVVSLRDHPHQQALGTVTTRPDRVYVTTSRPLAAACAAFWSKRHPGSGWGWLYRVEVDEEVLVADPDLPRGPFVSFQLSRARVAAVLERGIDPRDARHARELQRILAAMR